MNDDTAILDYQLDKFTKFGLEPVIMLGYKGYHVIDYCNRRGYEVDFEWDKTWRESYNLARLLKDNSAFFAGLGDFIMVHSDLLFRDDSLGYLMKCNADVCRVSGRNMLFRFTRRGICVTIEVLNDNPNLYTLNTPLWVIVSKSVTVDNSPPIWLFDVDRDEELNTARNIFK